MDIFQREVSRLFAHDGHEDLTRIELINSDGKVKTLVLSLKSEHFQVLADFLWGIVEDRKYPMPAIAVTPEEGFQVWIPLDESIELDTACIMADSLRGRYMAEVPTAGYVIRPSKLNPSLNCVQLPPTEYSGGRWSAFVDPTLVAMFKDESWLETPPNLDKQGELLSRIEAATGIAEKGGNEPVESNSAVPSGGLKLNAYEFLVMVMNDASLDIQHRIEAAKVLLAHDKR